MAALGQHIDGPAPEQVRYSLDLTGVPEIPVKGEPGKVVPVCLKCLWVMIRPENDVHSRLFEPKAHPSCARKQVCSEHGPSIPSPQPRA